MLNTVLVRLRTMKQYFERYHQSGHRKQASYAHGTSYNHGLSVAIRHLTMPPLVLNSHPA